MQLVYGKISEVDESKGYYRVELDEFDIVTDWLPRTLPNTLDNQDEAHFDVNEHVACIMDKHCEDGIIIGAINDDVSPPASGSNKDKRRTTYKDGSFVEFDRSTGDWTIDVKGNVNISSGGDVLVAADGVIELNGNSNNGIVKAATLKTKLNNLENLVNSLVTKFNSHVHVLTLTAGTGTAAPTVVPETTVLTPTVEPDLRNDNVKH